MTDVMNEFVASLTPAAPADDSESVKLAKHFEQYSVEELADMLGIHPDAEQEDEKLAYMMESSGGGDETSWLDQFKGTQLYEQAVQLAEQELAMREKHLRNRMERRQRDDFEEEMNERDQLCLQKKQLELALHKNQAQEEQAMAQQEQAAAQQPGQVMPGAPAGPQQEQPKAAASDDIRDVVRAYQLGSSSSITPGKARKQLEALAEKGHPGAQKVVENQKKERWGTAGKGALAGGALGGLGGLIKSRKAGLIGAGVGAAGLGALGYGTKRRQQSKETAKGVQDLSKAKFKHLLNQEIAEDLRERALRRRALMQRSSGNAGGSSKTSADKDKDKDKKKGKEDKPSRAAMIGGAVPGILGIGGGIGGAIQAPEGRGGEGFARGMGGNLAGGLAGGAAGGVAGGVASKFIPAKYQTARTVAPLVGSMVGGSAGGSYGAHLATKGMREKSSALSDAKQEKGLGKAVAGLSSSNMDPDRKKALGKGLSKAIKEEKKEKDPVKLSAYDPISKAS